MPGTTATPNLLTDPGYLWVAPLGSSEPTNTVTGSVFTDTWPVAWVSLGATKDGSTFSYNTKVDPIRVAEFFDPIKYKTTERSGSFVFSLADVGLTRLKQILNGGTLTVVSGTGATTLTSYTPPAPGAEVRQMIGWESLDNTLRIVCYQCFQGGDLQLKFMPTTQADHTVLPATFNLEMPSSGIPFKTYAAGVARG